MDDLDPDPVQGVWGQEWGSVAAGTGGALRGAFVGVARVATRPAQMRLLIWMAKRRWGRRAATQGQRTWGVSGFGSTVVIEAGIGSVMYGTYDATQRQFSLTDPPLINGMNGVYRQAFAAGACAGCANALLTTPHDNLLKRRHEQWLHVARDAARGGLGPSTLLRGFPRSAARDSFSFGVMFSSVRWFKDTLPQPPEGSVAAGTLHAFTAGGLAGVCCAASSVVFKNAPGMLAASQASGSLFFADMPKVLRAMPLATYSGVLFAGVAPAATAAFVPNALGMAAHYYATAVLAPAVE